MLNGQLAPDAGIVRLGGRDIVGLRPRADLAAGRRPHLPDHRHLRVAQRARQRADGALFPRRPAALAAVALWRGLHGGRRCAAGPGRHARPGRADLRRAGLWRPQEGRAGHGARQPAAAAADGRAHRRHGAEGADRADGARGPAGAGAQHRRAVHRARHGRGLRPGRPHHRARPRPADRRRHARKRCGPTRMSARSISGACTDARGQGPARLLRPRPHPARRVAGGGGRRGGGPARPQRRGQVDGDEGDHGPAAAGQGRGELRRPAHRAPADLPHRAAGAGLRAGGTPHLHRAHGRRKSRGRPPGAARRRCPPGPRTGCSRSFPTLPACASGRAAACRAASSRCSPSPAP